MLYEQVAQHYPWGHLLPLPAGVKNPPPVGYTGHEGRPVTEAERAAWAQHRGNYALRLPDGVVGLDVDQYGDKHGLETVAALEARLGPLPATWTSTGRAYETGSGIRFYRYPGGRLAGQVGESVEAIQHGHRYAVVWPSVAGERVYKWWTPAGELGAVPQVHELPELPAAWVAHLQAWASQYVGASAAPAARDALLVALITDPRGACMETYSALQTARERLAAAGDGGRHDAANAAVLRMVATCAEGHAGLGWALGEFADLWDEAVADPSRSAEFGRMVNTAAAKVASVHPTPVGACKCEQLAALHAAPLPPSSGEPVTTPAPTAPQVFDPIGAATDRDVSDAVGMFMLNRARYATDAGAWLNRGPDGTWALLGGNGGEGAKAVVQLAGRTHPRGDAKGQGEEVLRASRYKRLTTPAGVGGLAAMLVNTSRVGSPWSLRLTDLDTDPTLLWAGGRAYDLTKCAEGPVLAGVDPETPHLASCPVVPDPACPTPLWDELLRVMLPDPDQRAWALRVFGVAVTGESHRTLGILWGPKGSGKTSLLSLVGAALGSYTASPNASLLDTKTATQVDEFGLMGKRLAWVDEGPRTGKWATERLKALTGGAAMTARGLYKDPVTWYPTHTLFLTSNDEPQVTDEALRSRVRSVRMTADKTAVRPIMEQLGGVHGRAWRAEMPGVLARLMAEAAGYLADRSSADNPAAVEAELEALAREQDPVTLWLDERTTPGETLAGDLYADFREYVARSGFKLDHTPTVTGWGRRLTELGYVAKATKAGKTRPLQLRRGGGSWAPFGTPTPGVVEAPVDSPDPGPSEAPKTGHGVGDQLHGSTGHQGPSTGHQGPSTGHLQGVEHPANPVSTVHTAIDHLSGDQLGDQLVTSSTDNRSPNKPLVGGSSFPLGDQLTSFLGVEGKKVEEREDMKEGEKNRSTGHRAPFGLPAVKPRGGSPSPTELADLAPLLATLVGQCVTLDCETTGYPYGHPAYRLRTVQVGTADWCAVLDAEDPEQLAAAVAVLDAASELVAHSATADVSLTALAAGRDSAPWWDKTTDTAILAALADPELTGLHRKREGALSLEALSAELLPEPYKPTTNKARAALFRAHKWLTNTTHETPPERSGWAMVNPGDPVMLDYAASDVLDTAELRATLPDPAPAVAARERDVQRIMARLPERGLRLDPARVAASTATVEHAAAVAADKLAGHGITDPGSNALIGQVLTSLGAELPPTDTGKPSTAAAVIERLAEHPGPAQQCAQDLLEWREHAKILSTYLHPFGVQAANGGRSYPTILTLGAASTGRMSSVRPNIQQVPRPSEDETKPGGGGGIRGCFVADPGTAFISADFSSVEVRIAAHVTGDATLARMVREGMDLHGEVVKLAWGLNPGEPGFKDARYAAKRCIAEGQLVLTDAGLVPIEAVNTEHRVWDGLSWVSHSGVVDQGVRDVLTYQGLTATPDHVVYTEDANTVCLGYAAEHGIDLANTALGGQQRRLPDSYWARVPEGEPRVRPGEVHTVRPRVEEVHEQHRCRQGPRLSVPGQGQVHRAGEDSGAALRRGEAAVHAGHDVRQGVWRPGHPGAVRVPGALRSVGLGELAVRGLREVGGRPDRLGRPLRAWESTFGGPAREQLEQARHAVCQVHGPGGCQQSRPAPDAAGSPGHAVRTEAHREAAEPRAYSGGDSRHEAQWARAQTYDIGNAGPGHRFTVSGRLVANCIFGYLYGAGLPTMAKQLGAHAAKAPAVVDALRALTPQLVEWDRNARNAVRDGRLSTWQHHSGRVAYFDKDKPHKTLNTVVQGFGRELLVDAVLRWESLHPGCVTVPLHDELVIQVPRDQAEAWTADLVACMTFTLPTPDGLGVPIVCEPDPPTSRWGTTETM